MPDADVKRLKIAVRGAVQGVGFRPFVYRLATGLGLSGWVMNSSEGVFIEAEGEKPKLDDFLLRLNSEKPVRAIIQSLQYSLLDKSGYSGFEIRKSADSGAKTALVLPDIAACAECRAEILNPFDRRFDYPFTNCTNCGPRFTIIEAIPYDRANTSMEFFPMCGDCRREYENPEDRRFHAEPVACHVCGPKVELWTAEGEVVATGKKAVSEAALAIGGGRILALKGIGGFHLIANAGDEKAVATLRARKRREAKPFAVMFPSLDSVKRLCEVSRLEERVLTSAESPIVILRKLQPSAEIAPSVAPRNPYLGAMLPYSPLHILLMEELGFPVVATSGNLSDEPIVTDEKDAPLRLQGIADLFLIHNRPIVRHVDDSIVRVLSGGEQVLRRARGYAPLPVSIRIPADRPAPTILAVGAHLKNTVALSVGGDVFISQHIGDLETQESFEAFRNVIEDFKKLYSAAPDAVACDMHPDYLSAKYARTLGLPVVAVQHHHAHVASCMAENELEGRVLGVSWDGTGWGGDGTVWGGEFLLADYQSYERVMHFKTFLLPGGDAAIREPRRAALGLLFEIWGQDLIRMRGDVPLLRAFSEEELRILLRMMGKGLNSPRTSSVGRIFDGVSALVGLTLKASFEGEAASELEYGAASDVVEAYPFEMVSGESKPGVADWSSAILAILDDVRNGAPVSRISAKFHNTLAEIALQAAQLFDMERVVLTGGVFQNRYLTELLCRRLRESGFKPYTHQRAPANDGGISLGQVAVASEILGRMR